MARMNYAKVRAREQGRDSLREYNADQSAMRRMTRPQLPKVTIAKADARAQATAAMAVYEGTIKRHLKCFNCHHEGTIEVRCEKDVPLPMRAVCSRCGRKIHLGGWDP